MNYKIYPPDELTETTLNLPLSKSISNRVLIINALTGNKGTIPEVAKCDDTDVMTAALESKDNVINIGAAGTAMRFLTAYFAQKEGAEITLTGSERMTQRPIKVLVDALRKCGASIEYAGNEGFPPLKISGRRLIGGEISLPADISSQYISALLMITPYMEKGLKLTLEGNIVSLPYINMTISLMARWGVEANFTGNTVTVSPQEYSPVTFDVEADWSAASYWFETAALTASEIALDGLYPKTIQGDAMLTEFYKAFGVESRWIDTQLHLEPSPDLSPRLSLDLSEQPDLAQALTVTACMLNIPFHFKGLSTLKIKETDRLSALHAELRKLGFEISIIDDNAIDWEGERYPVDFSQPVSISTYKDHRMAMAFAPIGYFLPGIIIEDVDVVTKSYPTFWDDMRKMGFIIEEAE